MFRRSRFSVRPNVGASGRSAANPQEAPAANQLPSETPRDVGGDEAVVTPEKNPGGGNEPSGDSGSASAALQRRKRFSVKPKVAPGRPVPIARAAKSPVKPVSDTAAAASDVDKPTTSGRAGPAVGLGSPRRRRPSGDVGQATAQPKPTPAPSESSTHSAEKSRKPLESASGSQVKEAPPRVPPVIPDKEATELSEKAKTLVSTKSRLSLSPSALSLSRLLNDPSDLQRLAKAQKLKELLREESHKEKKLKRAKRCVKKFTLDPTKMTMRDLLRYVPQSNPMTSSLENSTQEEETVIPASPGREERSPERAQPPQVIPKIMSPSHEEDEEADEEEEALMVPQVKVAEDGSLIIDEESLTVEVQRAKGPNPADDRDPIFERGSTTTYSSFRKGTCSKPWCSEETDMFFLAISMVGTDFSMICQLFPHRARAEIKNKFKKEERVNAWRIDKAFRERRKLDIEYFSKLLEKVMEVQKNRKKLRSLAEKPPKKRKAKGKKAARKLSDVDEEDEEDENLPDLDDDEEGGGKENELLCNEGEEAASKPKKQRKRKTGADASKEEPRKKKSKLGEKGSEQDEFCTPQDAEAALPEDSDISVSAENAGAKDSVQPAKPSRGRAAKPRLPLGRKGGRKVPPPSTAAKDSGDESGSEATSQQVEEDAPASKISANEENSSEDEEAPVASPKPTRYGRIPKPTKPLAYPCKADGRSSASEPTSSPEQHSPSAAKPKPECTAKRGRSSLPQSDQEPKKPRLVTLRASQSDDSDEENDQQSEEEQNPACSPSKDSTAPAFVPASLRSPQARISMVEETMEELDILANMPDVLGISQDALCRDASCEQAHNETCDHQLDLLVGVIDFLSSEHTEVVEDESYNEAAQTLLTIGNLYSQSQTGAQAHTPGATSRGEASHQVEDKMPPDSAAREQTAACEPAAFGDGGAESSSTEVIVLMEQQADGGDNAPILNEQTDSDANPVPRFQSSPESLKKSSPQTETGNLSTLKLELFQPSGTCQFESSFEQANQERGSMSSQPGKTETSSAAPGIAVAEPQTEGGLSTDPVQGQEHSCQSAAFTGSCVEDLEVSQEVKSEVASPLQPRRSRLQKVKPNLPPTCRAARVTKTPEERDSSPTPVPRPIAVMEPEPSCVSPSEKPSGSTGLEPALKLGTIDNRSIAEEKSTEDATLGQVPSGGSSLANKNTSEDKFQPSSEQARPETSSTEPQVEEGLNTHSAHGDGGEGLPVSQGTWTEVASPVQPRRSRLQKVKPNLPLASRDARSKPQVTKAFKESESSPAPIPQPIAAVESEPQPRFATPPEKATESTGPVSDLSESQDLSSSLTSTGERKSTDDATLGPVDAGAAAGGRSSEKDLQPSDEQTTALSGSVSESADENLMCDAENAELPVSQKAERPEPSEDVMVQGEAQASSSGTAGSAPSLEERTQVGFGLDSSSESSEPSVAHRRRRSVKVKPKPNLTTSVKASRSKLHLKGTSNSPDQQHVSTSLTLMREHDSAAQSEPEPTEKERSSVNSEALDSVESAAAEMEPSLPGTGDDDASSVLAPTQAAEVCSISKAAGPETGSGEKHAGDQMSRNTEVEVTVSSQGCKGDVSTGTTEVKTQPPDGSVALSGVRVLKEGSTKSEITSTKESSRQTFPLSNTEDKSPDAAQQTESRKVSQTSNDQSQSAHSTDESQSESGGASIHVSKAHPPRRGRLIKPKPNLARSSQLPKGRHVQRDTRAHADSKEVDASASHKPVSERRPERKPVEGAAEQASGPESHSDGSVVQLSQFNAQSPVGCSTPVPPAQSVSTLSSAGSQSLPCLSLFSDLLSEQVPSDPDEPFFILSLTEIPVSSSGEVVDGAAEPLSYRPVTDASTPRRSLPGERSGATAGDEPLAEAPVLREESEEKSRIDKKESGRLQVPHKKDLIKRNPTDANQERTTVQPPKTVEKDNDAEITPTKPTLRGARRKAKTQVKPTRTKQGSKALPPTSIQTVEPDACDATAGDEVVAVPQTESGDGDETAACAQGSSSGASAGMTRTRGARRQTGKPKDSTASSSVPPPGKAVPSCSKVPAPHGAGKPSTTAMPRPTRSPEEAHSALAAATTTQAQVEAELIAEQHSRCPTPVTGSSRRTRQVSASGGSDCLQSSSIEEEPTNVSQYFLSDIFTDVAEV